VTHLDNTEDTKNERAMYGQRNIVVLSRNRCYCRKAMSIKCYYNVSVFLP